MPDDEIERLRSILARAHEQPPEFLPDLLRKVKEGFSHQGPQEHYKRDENARSVGGAR